MSEAPQQVRDGAITRPWTPGERRPLDGLLEREWLVTNGLGGYASGTVSGVATRRYHGLLVAAHPAPLGRMMTVNHLWESLRLPDDRTISLGSEEKAGARPNIPGAEHLVEFRLEAGLPVWRYEIEGFELEKRIYFAHRRNTVFVRYRLTKGAGTVRLKLKPAVHFRGHDDNVGTPHCTPLVLTAVGGRYEFSCGDTFPVLRLFLDGGTNGGFTVRGERVEDVTYRIEESRGYEFRGVLDAPGFFRLDLAPGQEATLICSTDPWEQIRAVSPAEVLAAEQIRRRQLIEQAAPTARSGLAAELVLAADQFIFTPAARTTGEVRAHDEARSIIAGYHWFTDWGRDTMISLEGLTLTTGRHAEAADILHMFARHVKDGLIPNLFPERTREGLYHTADATLWFFHALNRYLKATGDRGALKQLLPTFRDIVEHHVRGTRFGIGVDPIDGLLRQGAEGYQLTWMDAKVGDWVVTPRRGKAVEINALWYNALRLLEQWSREEGEQARADAVARHADRCRESFNRRFWYEPGGHLYDVLDGPDGTADPALRPNQVFAIALDHPVLDGERWQAVLNVVREQLLTPVGLRSLAPGHPDYKPQYFGDLRARDAAYHQGTVWAWLIGPFTDAWMKAHPDDRAAPHEFLAGFRRHMVEACVASISEVFDAEPPHTPRGCVAQAWSVAEVLRCLAKIGA
ncbi:Amylo-alpha-1,6-glucosidase [Gemmata obscuriglobus]|uniref:Glycogen debranching protein n=1 Tax=Gemmata obscuriglobus TaxID=114 RepID=A0A2Z3H8X1_9BACT|nr:amylo-alpha-1,6-glucosidase [Gemmata obscuriglobus]AWM39445.1 glycogen debranching protein [Gemmata obscuriglobus]QEG27473.1 Amylo-alpha-1,6-glucosidase [Gemmata obscuriglobus]VTS04465.1 glycogen debranching protein : Glycogen debranching enzyme, putative OS=Geobacter daltonii (strain DSM 22248 / JCM 15807 / FRC-32) GN=Geob_3238 PE=4 SV=1: GDE_N: GDE_C [Gemmata obscuriglobus UQM 2246]